MWREPRPSAHESDRSNTHEDECTQLAEVWPELEMRWLRLESRVIGGRELHVVKQSEEDDDHQDGEDENSARVFDHLRASVPEVGSLGQAWIAPTFGDVV